MVKSKRNGGDIVVENTFLLETLKQLVEIPSVTGQEQQVGEYIFTALQACGMCLALLRHLVVISFIYQAAFPANTLLFR